LSLCTTAHPLYTRFTKIFGASISETTKRPNPTLYLDLAGLLALGLRDAGADVDEADEADAGILPGAEPAVLKAPYRPELLWETLRPLHRPGRARTEAKTPPRPFGGPP
jgi:hypothetical protein